jgi:hypothetical protein
MLRRDDVLSRGDRKVYDKARKRLDSVSEAQVRMWADSALWSVQQSLEQGIPEQCREGAVALLAAADSLLDRRP